MKVLVLGGSGGVGRHVLQQANARGHEVRTVVRGDVLDQGAMDAAVEDRDAVLVCLGIRRRYPISPWSRLISPPDLTERAIGVTRRAMEKHGVKRVVAISAAGVGESLASTSLVMRLLIRWSNLGVAYRDLASMEAVLAASSLDWMAVRPVTLTNLTRTESLSVVPRYGLVSNISRRSVAGFMLDQLEKNGPFRDRTPMIAA